MANFQTTLGHLLDDEESNHEEVAVINEGTRTNSSNSQDLNPFELPVIHLFKTNSEGHRAQFDILDIEATSEMLMKISMSGIIKDDPNIEVERVITI